MSHPAIWPGKSYYYPIGNTSPVDLLQGLPPEERADVLLLGCGDPRSILFTLWSQSKSSISRSIGITCCDAEPAVIARNVLLLSLIMDQDNGDMDERAWNIFFHLYIDRRSYDLLVSQCQKLVDLSESNEAWNSGPYGNVIRFCSEDSLRAARQMWLLSAQSSSLSRVEKDRIATTVSLDARTVLERARGTALMSTRSSGPLFIEAPLLPGGTLKSFWQKGMVSTGEPPKHAERIVNPTLYYTSSSEFDLHYGTDPLAAFHLARALAPIVSRNAKARGPTMVSIIRDAREQFHDWCMATWKFLHETPLHMVIRLFVGDAIAFCDTLGYSEGKRSCGAYVHPLSTKHLELDDSPSDQLGNHTVSPLTKVLLTNR